MHHYFLCYEPFVCKNRDIFMAAICDMAMGRLADCRYLLGIVHDGIKTGFRRKKGRPILTYKWYLLCVACY